MAYREIDVVIYDTVITAMNLPGGMVWKWARQKSQRVSTTAKFLAPKRTGALARSVTSFYEGSSRDQTVVGVSAGGPSAPYAIYVVKGTGGHENYIFPEGKAFKLPPSAGRVGLYRAWVRGQEANDFLSEALEDVMATL